MSGFHCDDKDIIFNGVVVAHFVEPGVGAGKVCYSEIEEFRNFLITCWDIDCHWTDRD